MRVLLSIITLFSLLLCFTACSSQNETFTLESMQAGHQVNVKYKLDGFEFIEYDLSFKENMVIANNRSIDLTDEELRHLDSYLGALKNHRSTVDCSSTIEFQLTYLRRNNKVGTSELSDKSCLSDDNKANFDAIVYLFQSGAEVPSWRANGNKSIFD